MFDFYVYIFYISGFINELMFSERTLINIEQLYFNAANSVLFSDALWHVGYSFTQINFLHGCDFCFWTGC